MRGSIPSLFTVSISPISDVTFALAVRLPLRAPRLPPYGAADADADAGLLWKEAPIENSGVSVGGEEEAAGVAVSCMSVVSASDRSINLRLREDDATATGVPALGEGYPSDKEEEGDCCPGVGGGSGVEMEDGVIDGDISEVGENAG